MSCKDMLYRLVLSSKSGMVLQVCLCLSHFLTSPRGPHRRGLRAVKSIDFRGFFRRQRVLFLCFCLCVVSFMVFCLIVCLLFLCLGVVSLCACFISVCLFVCCLFVFVCLLYICLFGEFVCLFVFCLCVCMLSE